MRQLFQMSPVLKLPQDERTCLADSDSIPQEASIFFFCDSVKLYLPSPQVYRTVYELFVLSMHLCALMVKKVECWYYIDTPGVEVEKAFVKALATVVLTNNSPNGMKFPMLVLIQEVSEEHCPFSELHVQCEFNQLTFRFLFKLSG